MPPFKNGLLKRKLDANDTKKPENESFSKQLTSDSADEKEDEELIRGEVRSDGDDTDSDHQHSAASDDEHELDEVLFDEDVDSTLGDDEADTNSDKSSELTDSEADEESEHDGDTDNGSGSQDEANDSGLESGVGRSSAESATNRKSQPTRAHQVGQVKQVQNRRRQKSKSSVDVLIEKVQEASVNEPVQQKDEYESGDTSDEEGRCNTTGDVPGWWYDEYQHVGYDHSGRRLLRPPRTDAIDHFLRQCEDPDFWRTVRDPSTGQDVVLSKDDLELIARIRTHRTPDPHHRDYQPWVEWFSGEVLATPLRAFPEHKRSFLPSASDRRQIARIVHALKMGWLKTNKQLAEERKKRKEKRYYDLWGEAGEAGEAGEGGRALQRHIPAPRRALPGHAESYNPPPEYLLDDKEMKEWNKLATTPWKRKYTFLPTRHSSLREVAAYPRYVRERFLRCLDLYLAPRALKMRLTIDPEDLVPKLPSPRDLQPFPTTEVLRLRGHAGLVRSCDFDPSGQYIVSGGDDGSVKIWECSTGRCLRTLSLGEPVSRVCWTPVAGLSLVAAAAGARLLLLNSGAGSGVGAHRVAAHTDRLLAEPPPAHDVREDERTRAAAQWQRVPAEGARWAAGERVCVTHFRPVRHVAWHARGDYLCVTLEDAASRSVLVHQLSRRRSQLPFSRAKGLVQCALFHPVRPLLFVATQRVVRVYDLVKQELVRKLLTGAQWISSMAVHPAGDNLLVASYDRKCMWFDLELSAKPYQTLRLHGGAVRAVTFHTRYPLFATAGDDPYIVVSHGMVYNDLLQNPLLVPLKQLRAPDKCAELCALDVRFHPARPWLLAAGADCTLRLYA